jgi:hypothetical protein
MSTRTKPERTPGSIAVAIVVALMFASPVLAATTLNPVGFKWRALVSFVAAHQFELILGFGLMVAIALLLKAAASNPTRAPTRIESLVPKARPHGIDGLV